MELAVATVEATLPRKLPSCCNVMTIEDRIRELCAKAAATQDQPKLESILTDLRLALHEHKTRLPKLMLILHWENSRSRGRIQRAFPGKVNKLRLGSN